MSQTAWQVIGPYRGLIHGALPDPALVAALGSMSDRLQEPPPVVIQAGRHLTVRLALPRAGAPLDVAVKRFGRQTAWKDRWDWRHGTKASRTFAAACRLEALAIGTPAPVAVLERWSGRRLLESYYISRFVDGTISFKDELIRLFCEEPECASFMALLETVVRAIRRLHDAGFQHRDLGNQNILLGPLPAAPAAAPRAVCFIDLNRARCGGRPLSPRGRARDLSRLYLPSDFRRVFFEMYWETTPPPLFLRHERRCRALFAWHTLTRRLRHPLRHFRGAAAGASSSSSSSRAANYPAPREQWVWDSRSQQPVPTLRPRDRRRHISPTRLPRLLGATLPALPALMCHWRALRREAFAGPVPFHRSVLVALSGEAASFEQEVALARELGIRDLFLRFHHHDAPAQRRSRLAAATALTDAGFHLAGGLLQDRRAVRDPASWAAFCHQTLTHIGWHLDWLEFGHAINRVKWGIWGFEDYGRLLRCLPELRQAYPGVKLTGPAVIDFECEHALEALRELPPDCAWDALSMHLYVDRRGAPENRQWGFDALGKFAMARAVARAAAPRCADALIVSEINWPLLGTGVYSPVGAPHVSPGVRRGDPSVSEEDYADYLIRYLLLASCSGLARQVVVWRLAAHGFGLVDDRDPGGWRRRPAFRALQQWQRTLAGGSFVRREAVAQADPRRVYLLRCRDAAGAPLLVGWSHGAAVEAVTPFRLLRARDAMGESVSLPSDARLRLGPRPIYAWGVEER